MKAIIDAKVIEMNKAEAKAAGCFNTDEFRELSELRKAYPDFRIVIKTVKTRDNMKGLDIPFMEKYISSHDDEDGTIMDEFRLLRGLDQDGNKLEIVEPASYGELKMWFLSKYPELERFDVNAILARAKAAREEQKAARQPHNNNRLRAAIDELTRHHYITATRTGRTYEMAAIPKETEITMPSEWVLRILRHEYNSEGVAWENVLKVQLWLMQNAKELVTNEDISLDVGISISQVVAAMNVLKNEFQAFRKDYAYWSFGNTFRRKGQIIDMSAWWS